jgi:hypothetical protein
MVNPKLAGFTVDKSHLKNSFLFLSYNTRQLPPEKMKHIIRLSDNLDSVRLGKTGTNFIYKYIWEIVLWGLEGGGEGGGHEPRFLSFHIQCYCSTCSFSSHR